MLEGFSLGNYLLLVDYTGWIFRESKAVISREVAAIFDRLGSSAEAWRARLEKLSSAISPATSSRPVGGACEKSRNACDYLIGSRPHRCHLGSINRSHGLLARAVASMASMGAQTNERRRYVRRPYAATNRSDRYDAQSNVQRGCQELGRVAPGIAPWASHGLLIGTQITFRKSCLSFGERTSFRGAKGDNHSRPSRRLSHS